MQNKKITDNKATTEVSRNEVTRFKLSRDPNKAMQEMMFTIDRLRATLIEETRLLKDADTKSFMAMQDVKLDVARDYLEGMSQMMTRKDEFKNADENLRQRLFQMRDEFADIAYDNHAAINRMKNGMKRLGERIMEAAREASRKEKQIVYGSNGYLKQSGGGTIGVNESA